MAQHNDLIRAQYDMSLLEIRLFVAMLARINKGDNEFTLSRIPISELYPDDKVGGKTYTQVRKAVVRLASQVITVDSKDNWGVREIVSNPLMATCRYKQGSGYVVAQFNNFIKPYLLELKGEFTVAQELTLMSFRSFYSHRLYWLLKLSAYRRDTITVGLASIKTMLNLTDRYGNFSDFKRFVLDVARHEIASSDMAFEYAPVKEGRTVAAIQFNLLRPVVVHQEDTELPDGVQQKLTELGVSLKSLREIKSRYNQGKTTEEYIRFVLNYYDEANTKGRVRSLAGAIFKGLTTDQLAREFGVWKAENQPVYKAPQPRQLRMSSEKTIPLDELRTGWEVMKRKGLTNHETFEDSMAEYQNNPMYRIEERDGKEYLVVQE